MSAVATETPEATRYVHHLDHLEDELLLLDLLLLRAVLRMRRDGPPASGSQDVYIGHDEVDRLLEPADASIERDEDLDRRIDDCRRAIDDAAHHGQVHGTRFPLLDLAEHAGLSAAEYQALIVCLAPELDRKYDRLYCYLQDDVTRKRPSVDLAMQLLAGDRQSRWTLRSQFADDAPLLRFSILHRVPDPHSPSGSTALATFLRVDDRIVDHVLGAGRLDGHLAGCAELLASRPGPAPGDDDGELGDRLARIIQHHVSSERAGLVIHLEGAEGAPSVELANATAAALGSALVEFDAAQASSDGAELTASVSAAVREGWLLGVPVLIAHADAALEGTGARDLGAAMHRTPAVVITSATRSWEPWSLPIPVHQAKVPELSSAARVDQWRRELVERGVEVDDGAIVAAASRFALSAGEITSAVRQLGRMAAASADGAVGADDVFEACRARSSRALADLAQQLRPAHVWDDLVVPERSRTQLQEMCRQVRLRDVVLDEWGLGRKIASSRGVSALFTGPPGTGKTMAAGVIANDLGLDLFRIDLSQVVSKYIGETEKNLARIFAEAQSSSSVLFFDEADALFGKRTEIGDAHDRYANIETSYLLQEMERHDGVAILATNLQQNMDEAFMRRLGFVVDFPFPDAASRTDIWRRHLDGGAPLDDDLHVDQLADRLEVSGANIRNIVMAGAYLAAAEDSAVGMEHLVRGAEREFEKVGKLWTEWEATP